MANKIFNHILLLSILFYCVYCKSSLTSRIDIAPKGCKWQRILIDDSGNEQEQQPQQQQQQQQQQDTNDNSNDLTNILSCKLRTIGGTDSLLGNLSAYQIERITALKLECSDVLFFESSLETTTNVNSNHNHNQNLNNNNNNNNNENNSGEGFLSTLKRLKNLQIEYCKIRYVPSMVLSSLKDLRTLSLRTHNTDWSAMNLEFHPESFRSMTELKNLNLADNNIWSLPTEVFCPLYSLKYLNLTKNRLTDIQQLGFTDYGNGRGNGPGKACNTGLEILDLSNNDLSVLPDNGLSALRSLQSIYLQENLLISLGDRSFIGLQSLQILNMSSNRLIALPPELFQTTRELTQIYLHNNSLGVLAPGLLEGLDRLEVLDLSQNELTSLWIKRDTFTGLVRLVVLNLGHNTIEKIEQSVFRGLYSLQILNLEHNIIEEIAENSFSDLKNLHALTLSNNKIKTIEAYHLSELYVLTQLFFESNYIETIHKKSFENLTNLIDLNLNDNQLIEIPDGLGKLRFLKSLDIGKNKIKTINNNSFQGLEQLLGLRLVDNLITNISRDTFKTLKSLHVLNLASNQIKYIDETAFNLNPTIRAIRLDNNQLEDISGIFTSLPDLVWLNVSDNKLKWFDYSHLPASLEWLDMHKNNITELGNYFDVKNILKIKMLDVSFNGLTLINDGNIPDSIETIFLNNNHIKDVIAGTFLKKTNLEKVVLYGNEIKKIDITAFALGLVPEHKEMPQFFIGDNPFHCDCHMEWLQRINELSRLRQYPRVLDLDMVMCTMEHERGANIRSLMDLGTHDFLCKYDSHCFALCHCCDFDACDCKMTCPDRCSCYHDHAWSSNIVDCGNSGYTQVPERIPMDATAIYLDGNNLQELGSHMFIGKKKLEILYLNNSNVQSLHNRTFNGVPSLKILHMENNEIKELRGYEFDQLTNLNELYLDHNAIGHVGEQTFTSMKTLEILNLSDNKIVDFSPWKQLAAASESGSLAQVSMEGNKWKCDCNSLNKLQDWIKEVTGEYDVNRMLCTDERNVGEVMKGCQETREHVVATPAVQRTVLLGNGLIGGGYVPLLAAVVVAIIGTALLVALACVFRQDVRLWAHAKYGIRLFKDPTISITSSDDKEKLYDSYVIYSIKDSEFVSQIISTELQHSGYSLCLHHRDMHAATFLADSIQSASDASQKLLLLLSMNFLQTEWSQPQFRVALQSVLENIKPTNRRHKLVLILTAPVELIAMDPIMQILIRTCTVICWGEKRFWDKLRYALPDVNSNSNTVKKIGNLNKSPNLRYTPAPTNFDSWCKLAHPGVAMPIVDQQHITPSQSTSNTEDESSLSGSLSQHYEPAPNPNYLNRSQASLGHVYSTIPETPQMGRGRAYFV